MEVSALKVGVLSDLHHDPSPARERSWINLYDPARVLERVDDALRWFLAAQVDLVIVVGDTVERPNDLAFDEVWAALTKTPTPVAMVGGNHDWDITGLAKVKAREHHVTVLDEAALLGPVDVFGLAAEPSPQTSLFAAPTMPAKHGSRLIISHFPLLSEAERLARAGLPYPGDLTNRSDVEQSLQAERAMVVVISGHIHARCSRASGSILQLSCGALIEPPHDAAIVTVAVDLSWVERTARRLGPVSAVEPVFSQDVERWESLDGCWQLERARSDLDGSHKGEAT